MTFKIFCSSWVRRTRSWRKLQLISAPASPSFSAGTRLPLKGNPCLPKNTTFLKTFLSYAWLIAFCFSCSVHIISEIWRCYWASILVQCQWKCDCSCKRNPPFLSLLASFQLVYPHFTNASSYLLYAPVDKIPFVESLRHVKRNALSFTWSWWSYGHVLNQEHWNKRQITFINAKILLGNVNDFVWLGWSPSDIHAWFSDWPVVLELQLSFCCSRSFTRDKVSTNCNAISH